MIVSVDCINNNINNINVVLNNKEHYFNIIKGINYFLYYDKKEDFINKSKIKLNENYFAFIVWENDKLIIKEV